MTPEFGRYFGTTVRFHHPLLHLAAVRSALNLGSEGVNALIESGDLRWAFDLSTSKRRREIRVLAHSVANYQTKTTPPMMSEEDELRAVCDLIIPGSLTRLGVVGSYRACALARRLALASHIVNQFVARGELELLKPVHQRTGINATPEIKAASIQAFLKRRRITG
jgi:hypothetical protein